MPGRWCREGLFLTGMARSSSTQTLIFFLIGAGTQDVQYTWESGMAQTRHIILGLCGYQPPWTEEKGCNWVTSPINLPFLLTCKILHPFFFIVTSLFYVFRIIYHSDPQCIFEIYCYNPSVKIFNMHIADHKESHKQEGKGKLGLGIRMSGLSLHTDCWHGFCTKQVLYGHRLWK